MQKLKAIEVENVEREVTIRSNQDSEKLIAELKDEMKLLEVNKVELKTELDQAKADIKQLKNTVHSMEEQHSSALAMKDSDFERSTAAMKEQEVLAEKKMDELLKEVCTKKAIFSILERKIGLPSTRFGFLLMDYISKDSGEFSSDLNSDTAEEFSKTAVCKAFLKQSQKCFCGDFCSFS